MKVNDMSPEEYQAALDHVRHVGSALKNYPEQTDELLENDLRIVPQRHFLMGMRMTPGEYGHQAALDHVRTDGFGLRYFSDQTDELCLTAVRKNGYALQFV